MKNSRSNCLPALLLPLLCLFLEPDQIAAQDVTQRSTGDLIMSEKSIPLVPIGKGVFPDDGFVHRGASASAFMWPVDVPDVGHRANSILARVALLQYEPGGGTNARTYPDIRERAYYVIEGLAGFTLGHSKREVGAGDLVFAPSGVQHGYEVLGETPLKILLMEWRSGDRSKSRSLAATVVSERMKPLTRLRGEDAGSHQGMSSSPFITPQDYPNLGHKGNSSLAWISLREFEADPDLKPSSPHAHPTSEQAFYLLDGKARFVVGEIVREVGPGELVFAPRHVKHGYEVVGETPVKWLMMIWSSE